MSLAVTVASVVLAVVVVVALLGYLMDRSVRRE